MYQSTPLIVDAAAQGAGDAISPQSSDFTFVATQTAGTSATVTLEGSPDGTNWFTLATLSLTNDVDAATYSGKWNYVRGNITAFSGDENTKVNAYIMQ